MDSWRVPGNESSGSSGHRPVPRRVRKPVVVVPSPVESGSSVSEKKRQWKMVSPELPSVLDDINQAKPNVYSKHANETELIEMMILITFQC